MTKYWVLNGKETIGPFPIGEIMQRVPGFTRETLVAPDGALGSRAWRPAWSYEELRGLLPGAPPLPEQPDPDDPNVYEWYVAFQKEDNKPVAVAPDWTGAQALEARTRYQEMGLKILEMRKVKLSKKRTQSLNSVLTAPAIFSFAIFIILIVLIMVASRSRTESTQMAATSEHEEAPSSPPRPAAPVKSRPTRELLSKLPGLGKHSEDAAAAPGPTR